MIKLNKLITGRPRDDNVPTGSPFKSGGKRVLHGFERECGCVYVVKTLARMGTVVWVRVSSVAGVFLFLCRVSHTPLAYTAV